MKPNQYLELENRKNIVVDALNIKKNKKLEQGNMNLVDHGQNFSIGVSLTIVKKSRCNLDNHSQKWSRKFSRKPFLGLS